MQKYMATKYMRLSYTDDRTNESDSITNQKKLIDEFVKNNPDIEIVSEKVDDGYSGIVFDRPAFKEMMQDIVDGKINCVIVKDLSRFGREYIETGRHLREIFPAYGVRFIAITDNIDTAKNSEMDGLEVSIKNIMNDAYCRDISKKTRSSLNAKRKNGDFVGACAVYGYLKSEENKNQLIIDEYTSKVVQDIFGMKIDGYSANKIADELNGRGILSPSEYKKSKGLPQPKGGFADRENGKWSATTIIRILKDETYTGTLIQGKQSTLNYKLKNLVNNPVDEWVRNENAHELIIRQHDFDLVQKIMHLDTRIAPGGKKVQFFSGILICGSCGSRMTRKTNTYKGKKYYYYFCPTGKKNDCENSNMIKEADLIDCVVNSLKAHIDSVVTLNELMESINEETINRALVQQNTVQIEENEKQLAKYKKLKSTLYENLVNGILSKDEWKEHKEIYSAECTRFKNAIEVLTQEIEDLLSNKGKRMKWVEHFKRFSTMTEIDRTAVIQLIKSIHVIDKTTIKITFNYKQEYDSALETLSNINIQREVV